MDGVVIRVKRKRAEESSDVIVLGEAPSADNASSDDDEHIHDTTRVKRHKAKPESSEVGIMFRRVATVPVNGGVNELPRSSGGSSSNANTSTQLDIQYVKATRMAGKSVVDAFLGPSMDTLAHQLQSELTCNYMPLVREAIAEAEEEEEDISRSSLSRNLGGPSKSESESVYVFDIYHVDGDRNGDRTRMEAICPWIRLPSDDLDLVLDGTYYDDASSGADDCDQDSNAEDYHANDYPDEDEGNEDDGDGRSDGEDYGFSYSYRDGRNVWGDDFDDELEEDC